MVLPRRVLFDNSQKEPQDATRRRRRLCDIKLCRQWLLRERRERRRLRLRTAALCIVPFTTVKNHDKSKFTLLLNIKVERAKRVRLGKTNCNTYHMPLLFSFFHKKYEYYSNAYSIWMIWMQFFQVSLASLARSTSMLGNKVNLDLSWFFTMVNGKMQSAAVISCTLLPSSHVPSNHFLKSENTLCVLAFSCGAF